MGDSAGWAFKTEMEPLCIRSDWQELFGCPVPYSESIIDSAFLFVLLSKLCTLLDVAAKKKRKKKGVLLCCRSFVRCLTRSKHMPAADGDSLQLCVLQTVTPVRGGPNLMAPCWCNIYHCSPPGLLSGCAVYCCIKTVLMHFSWLALTPYQYRPVNYIWLSGQYCTFWGRPLKCYTYIFVYSPLGVALGGGVCVWVCTFCNIICKLKTTRLSLCFCKYYM